MQQINIIFIFIVIFIFSVTYLMFKRIKYLVSNKKTKFDILKDHLLNNSSLSNKKKPILWIIFILPLISILYEPAIFYYTFFAATVLIKMKNENLIKIFFIIFLIFIPSIIVSYYSAFHIISKDGFEIMKSSLMNNFGEACHMSCGLMDTKREAIVHIKATISKLTEKEFSIFTYLFRYFLIMLILVEIFDPPIIQLTGFLIL